MPSTKPNVPVRGLNYILTFGKHKGKTIQQVIDEEPTYIDWAVGERIFVLDEEADDRLLDALELKATREQDIYDDMQDFLNK